LEIHSAIKSDQNSRMNIPKQDERQDKTQQVEIETVIHLSKKANIEKRQVKSSKCTSTHYA